MDVIYNIFGSEDSIDTDAIVFVDSLPKTKEDCKNSCLLYEKMITSDKKINVNLAVVKDGIITECFKGTADEVNNSVLTTYGLHLDNQKFPLMVLKPVKRNVELKVGRSLRIILSFLSRTMYKNNVKEALKGDPLCKINALRDIQFIEIDSFNKNGVDDLTCWKTIAFQIIQATALLCGKEIYTKSQAKDFAPNLSPFINRGDHPKYSCDILNYYLSTLCDYAIKLDPDLMLEDKG